MDKTAIHNERGNPRVRSASHLNRDIYNISDRQQTKGSWHLVTLNMRYKRQAIRDVGKFTLVLRDRPSHSDGSKVQ